LQENEARLSAEVEEAKKSVGKAQEAMKDASAERDSHMKEYHRETRKQAVLGYLAADFWEVLGHVLSEDGNTVLDTFPLSIRHIWDDSPGTTMYSQWEFIRRYMEEGPEKLCGQVDLVMPIDEQRESYLHGFKRLFANYLRWPVAMVILSPALFIGTIGRRIAMQTSKIPRWPAEVEAESQIDPNDPYIRDEHHLAAS